MKQKMKTIFQWRKEADIRAEKRMTPKQKKQITQRILEMVFSNKNP